MLLGCEKSILVFNLRLNKDSKIGSQQFRILIISLYYYIIIYCFTLLQSLMSCSTGRQPSSNYRHILHGYEDDYLMMVESMETYTT